jgi:hypothetical protein
MIEMVHRVVQVMVIGSDLSRIGERCLVERVYHQTQRCPTPDPEAKYEVLRVRHCSTCMLHAIRMAAHTCDATVAVGT